MYEYKFIDIPLKKSKKALIVTEADYQELIRSHAAEGWRLVQIFAPMGDGLLIADHYQIILERSGS
ncbi:hypothetical protein B9T62_04975 [Paenibacillus donghaensis]|uniref:DUF4177 domain-containing protein n=2 Tax=Paenibacillus donghaensis TaxID=414771 RepID=A0A2Z2KB59_9BACL|nr:hypothetical protein B9T62_04975 [Paenibacillus donghaensis]